MSGLRRLWITVGAGVRGGTPSFPAGDWVTDLFLAGLHRAACHVCLQMKCSHRRMTRPWGPDRCSNAGRNRRPQRALAHFEPRSKSHRSALRLRVLNVLLSSLLGAHLRLSFNCRIPVCEQTFRVWDLRVHCAPPYTSLRESVDHAATTSCPLLARFRVGSKLNGSPGRTSRARRTDDQHRTEDGPKAEAVDEIANCG